MAKKWLMVEVAVCVDTELTDESNIMDCLDIEINSGADEVSVDKFSLFSVENYYEFKC